MADIIAMNRTRVTIIEMENVQRMAALVHTTTQFWVKMRKLEIVGNLIFENSLI